MSNNHRELTGREKQRMKKLIISYCANYDKEYGCLPLDCECPMFSICYTNSALCRRFRNALLPTAPELETVFTRTPTTICRQCDKLFPRETGVLFGSLCRRSTQTADRSTGSQTPREKEQCVTILPSESLVPQGFLEGISVQVRCLYLSQAFNRINGYTIPEPKLLYENFETFSTHGGDLPMVKNEDNSFSYMTRRIGGTTYKVKVVFNETGHETMEDKILRMMVWKFC